MATVACKCGEKFHPSPEHFGKEVRCRRCGRTVTLTPDPRLDPPPPPPPKSTPFTQTFGQNAPPPPQNSYAPPPVAQQQAPDPNAPPPGLHPEVRKILIYAALIFAAVAAGLIFSSLKSPSPPAIQQAPPEM